jgi:ABC-type transport system involved in Fe-S cluster assembly fused permease/ATPase subunit
MSPQDHLFLRFLHYSTPIAVVLLAVILSTVSACITPPSRRTVIKKRQRKRAKWTALAVAVLYVNEGLVYVLQTRSSKDWMAGQDTIVYLALSALLWTVVFFFLDDAGTVYRNPNLASWIIATVLEVTVCLMQFSHSSTHSRFDNTRLFIHLLRICCLAGLCISAATSETALVHIDVERQPLLRSSDTTLTTTEYGSVPKAGTLIDNDDNDEEIHGQPVGPKAVDQQTQRLELLGGWWKYLQQFRLLAPHFIPLQERRHQGFALIVAIVILCDRLSNLIGPRLLGDIVSRIAGANENDELPWRQILFFILVIKIPHDHFLVPLRSFCSVRLYYASYRKVLISSFSHIMGLSLEFHENKNTGEVEAIIRQGESLTRFFDECMDNFIPLFLDLALAFVYLSWMFSITLGVVLAFVYVLYVIATYKFTAWLSMRRRRYLGTDVEVRDLMNQSLSNWQMAVYFNRQDYLCRRLEELVGREVDGMARFNDLSHIRNVAQGLIMTFGYGAVLLLAAQQVIREKQPVGNIVMLLLYWNIITRPLFALANSYKELINYLVDAERLLQIRQMTSTVTDVDGAPDLEFKGGKIEYRNVHFEYDKGNPLIKGLNFTVEPGSTIAFVGATGSGKTTTCDKLLFRLYDVTEGSILIDDQDLRSVTQDSLRETMGIVRQDQTFYNDTILENVRFARLEATDEEVYEACRNAVIHDKILSFPNGYHSKIGERGVKLSGGEKQRLFIAQLFLRDPKIVILDEATSTVDNMTESEIQDSFARICKGRTTVIIAHRLSTVKDADQIFVLDQGEIVERGTHDELLGQRGKYYHLWATKRTVEKLQKVLIDGDAVVERNDIPSALTRSLVDLSDDTDSLSLDYDEDIFQIEGASDTKQMQDSKPSRTGIRKRMHDVKSPRPDKEQTLEGEFHDEAEDDSLSNPSVRSL